jgi:hypothetical protein
MPRYVILQHDFPELHWDFMVEAGPALRTWRLDMPPQAGQAVAATASFDHRLLYLDYEGPVSGNRGRVIQWDRGEYEDVAFDADRLDIQLRGRKLRGRVTLQADGMLSYHPASEEARET